MAEMVKKIYYHDTDCGGVVYYANYLKYFEEARTEYFFDKGADIKDLSEKGILFIVRRVEIDYKFPARYGDIITVFSDVVKVKNVSLEFFQQIKRKDQLLVSAKTWLGCVDSTFKPCRMSKDIIHSFTQDK